jgi:hypothetical protein
MRLLAPTSNDSVFAAFVVGAHHHADRCAGVSAWSGDSGDRRRRRSDDRQPSRAVSRSTSRGTPSVFSVRPDRFDRQVERAAAVDFARYAVSHTGPGELGLVESRSRWTQWAPRSGVRHTSHARYSVREGRSSRRKLDHIASAWPRPREIQNLVQSRAFQRDGYLCLQAPVTGVSRDGSPAS